jgi:hypothetical protein
MSSGQGVPARHAEDGAHSVRECLSLLLAIHCPVTCRRTGCRKPGSTTADEQRCTDTRPSCRSGVCEALHKQRRKKRGKQRGLATVRFASDRAAGLCGSWASHPVVGRHTTGPPAPAAGEQRCAGTHQAILQVGCVKPCISRGAREKANNGLATVRSASDRTAGLCGSWASHPVVGRHTVGPLAAAVGAASTGLLHQVHRYPPGHSAGRVRARDGWAQV